MKAALFGLGFFGSVCVLSAVFGLMTGNPRLAGVAVVSAVLGWICAALVVITADD